MSKNVQTHIRNRKANTARFLKCVGPVLDIAH